MPTNRRLNLDRWGAIASFICAVHCVLTSIALGVLSVVGLGFLGSHLTDYLFVGFALAFGGLAVVQGYRKHHQRWPAVVFFSGLATVIGSHVLFGHESDYRVLGGLLSALGGLMLVIFHIANATLQKTCCQQVVCDHAEEGTITPKCG